MAGKKLKAQFFIDKSGMCIEKAKPLTRTQRYAIYHRDKGVCKLCGIAVAFGGTTCSPFQEIASGQIDHIMPRSRGGQNNEDNLRLLCLTCNSQKGAR